AVMREIQTVFIVDNDIDDREIFVEAIETISPAIKCITAVHGEDALAKLNASSADLPEIIFLDLNMPRMDGKEFLGTIKKDARFNNIPVVIYSTSFLKKDIDETRLMGAAHFLAKPSDFRELCKELSMIIRPESTIT